MVMPIIMFPSSIISSFSGLLIPEFSRFYAKKDYYRIQKNTKKILKITSLFSIIIGILCFIFSDILSLIIYKSNEVSTYIKALSPLIFFMYVDNVIDSILKGLDKQVSVMFCNILDLIISISFIYFAIPIFGIRGYIAMFYISEILNFIVSATQLKLAIKPKIG